MTAPVNLLKQRLLAGEDVVGLWLTLGSSAAAELAGWCGFDWCLVDGEHAPNDLAGLQAQLQALAGTPAAAMVRVPVNETRVIKQVLDLGAQSIMVPMVDNAADAAAAAAAMLYPPAGIRGIGGVVSRSGRWGAVPDYTPTANEQVFLAVQAESADAVADIDAIAATPGVDAVFIGPADLAAGLGHIRDPDHAEVQEAIAHVISRTRAAGKVAGILTFDPSAWGRWHGMGAQLIAVGAESFELRQRLSDLSASARVALGKGQ